MALSRRQKLTIISLLVYWPAIFVLGHIPIPGLVYKAGVSDKSLHLLAYLVLVFLLWFAMNPDRKVNWRRGTVWRVLLVVVLYGLVDELLQPWVGRTYDTVDLLANVTGTLGGLILLAFLTFWPALLVVTGTVVFLLTNLCRANPADLLPVTSVMFYLFAYGFFTLVWIQYMNLSLSLKAPRPKWIFGALVLPIAFLLVVKLFSVILGRPFSVSNVLISAAGIAGVVVTIFLVTLFRWPCAQLRSGST
ncbi:MAG: VanZ family protein [Planctomycetota bacterium]|jgi:VanZ family protein